MNRVLSFVALKQSHVLSCILLPNKYEAMQHFKTIQIINIDRKPRVFGQEPQIHHVT
jgi:hypothetical protein